MLVMKENYNKKIAPLSFDYEEQVIIPVDVNISIAVMDVLSIQEVNLVYEQFSSPNANFCCSW